MTRPDSLLAWFPRLRNVTRERFRDELIIDRSGDLTVAYAPFEYVNPHTRLVLVGITPGEQQAWNAIQTARTALEQGSSEEEALRQAKSVASFSGPMRRSLIRMLDVVGLPEAFGLSRAADLFEERSDLVHYTSVLRYPVFLRGANYSGTPRPMKNSFLQEWVARTFEKEVRQLPEAIYVPLGSVPSSVLESCVERGLLRPGQVLAGLPHPSGANAERIAYFCGAKAAENLSSRTNAGRLDQARRELIGKVADYRRRFPPVSLPG